MTSFVCWIPGKPTPQGSKKAFVINGRAVLVDASGGNKAWRKIVTETLKAHKDYIQYAGPVKVSLAFYMEKPKSNRTEQMAQMPDVDKLCRSVLDGLTDSLMIEDDARVVSLSATKYWAVDTQPGVMVTVWQDKPDA
jgi:Holliday junction resolvase RusA-like endonuclease